MEKRLIQLAEDAVATASLLNNPLLSHFTDLCNERTDVGSWQKHGTNLDVELSLLVKCISIAMFRLPWLKVNGSGTGNHRFPAWVKNPAMSDPMVLLFWSWEIFEGRYLMWVNYKWISCKRDKHSELSQMLLFPNWCGCQVKNYMTISSQKTKNSWTTLKKKEGNPETRRQAGGNIWSLRKKYIYPKHLNFLGCRSSRIPEIAEDLPNSLRAGQPG